jgi:hypothetical protein
LHAKQTKAVCLQAHSGLLAAQNNRKRRVNRVASKFDRRLPIGPTQIDPGRHDPGSGAQFGVARQRTPTALIANEKTPTLGINFESEWGTAEERLLMSNFEYRSQSLGIKAQLALGIRPP